MNESADKGQGVFSRFVDPAKVPCTNESTIGENQGSFKFKSPFQESSGFYCRLQRGLNTKSTTKANEIIFLGAGCEKVTRQHQEIKETFLVS